MKILYLAHRLPYPPNKGDKIRSFHEVEYLSRRHRVWCACFVDDRADLGHVGGLEKCCEAVAAIPLNALMPRWSRWDSDWRRISLRPHPCSANTEKGRSWWG